MDQRPQPKDRYTEPDRKNIAGNSIELIGTGRDILIRAQLAQALRSTIKKWEVLKP